MKHPDCGGMDMMLQLSCMHVQRVIARPGVGNMQYADGCDMEGLPQVLETV
jgi:hypothetical protein